MSELWPAGGGETGALIRAAAWARTPLGAIEGWPQTLRTAVQTILEHPFPAVVLWGPDLVQIYNDGYRRLMGETHPAAMGRPTRECRPEAWHIGEPIYRRVWAGESVSLEDARFPITRPGTLEDAWFTLSYSPLRDEAGAVAGVLVTAFETTARVLEGRRRDAAEAALGRSEERFRLLVESLAQAVWETDPAGVVVADSPSWRAYTGQTVDEWLGFGWVNAIHPDDRAYAERQWLEAVEAGRTVNTEFRMRSARGGWRWTNVRAAPQRGPDGAIQRWVGMNIDLSPQKEAEAALRDSEEKYRALFEEMDEAYAVVEVMADAEGRWNDFLFLDANPAFVQHTGMPYPVGRTATDILGTPNPRWAEIYGRVAETGEAVRVEEGELTLGRIFDLNIFRLGGPGSRRVAVLFTNITERRRAEEALREREADLARVQRIGEVGGLDIDVADGLRGWRSPEYLRLHGLPADSVRETHEQWLARVHPDDRAHAERALRAALEGTGGSYQSEYRIVRPSDGAVRWIHARGDIERDAGGRAVRLRGAHLDVTEQKLLQEALFESGKRQAFLLRLSDALRPLTHPVEMQTAAMQLLAGQLGVMRATYFEVDPDQDGFTLTSRFERDAAPIPERMRLSDFAPEMSAAYRAGRTLVFRDTETETQLGSEPAAYRPIGVRAWAAVPLVKDGRLVAIVGVHSRTPRDWADAEVHLLEDVAERTWSTVERARAEAALHEAQQRQAFLLKLSDALRPLAGSAEMERTAMRLLGEELRVNRAFYATVDADGESWSVQHDYADGVPGNVGRFPMSGFQRRRLAQWRAGQMTSVADSETDPTLSAADRAAYAAFGTRAAIGIPLIKGGKFSALLSLNQTGPREWTQAELALASEVAERTWAALEQAHAEEALRINDERMRGQKEAFQAAINGAPLADSLGILARVVSRETAGEARTAFYIADEEGVSLHPVRGAGDMPDSYLDRVDGFLIGEDSLACGLAVPTGRAVLSRDVFDEPRWVPWTHMAAEFDYRGCWSFPIKTRDEKAVGTFAMYFRGPREPTPRDLALADVVTRTAAVIISTDAEGRQRMRAEEALRELNETLEGRVQQRTAELILANEARREVLQQLVAAEENERKRISRELHDSLGQMVTGLMLGLKMMERDSGRHAAQITGLVTLADRIARELQHLALELRPLALDNLGLPLALQAHVEEWSARHEIEASLHFGGMDGQRFPGEVETTVYRVVQEGLTNILKHAAATLVSLVVELRSGVIHAILEDNGRGFDPDETLASPQKANRLGLRGMRERLALLGGSLLIESSPGQGTTLFARIPIRPPGGPS